MTAVRECTDNIGIIADVALDPYTTHGQDGLLRDGVVVNDETLSCFVNKRSIKQEPAVISLLPQI